MASILFTDADGTWRLHNGKPHVGGRFQSWTPDSLPFGESAARQSDRAITMLRLSDDFGVSFALPMIPSVRSNNMLLRPEELDHATWTLSNATVSANAEVAPDGYTGADKLAEANTTPGVVHAATQTIVGATDNTDYLYSCYLKAVDRSEALLQIRSKANTFHFQFVNMGAGALGNSSGIVAGSAGIHLDGNGFYRAWFAANIASGGTTPLVYVYIVQNGEVSSYAGTVGVGINAWGAQLEPNTRTGRPTPYLMTTSAARSGVSMHEIADRLRYHLVNGGTCYVSAGDSPVWNQYATCGLKPGTTPQLALSDNRTLEHTLSLQLINLAGSPTRMLARYAEL